MSTTARRAVGRTGDGCEGKDRNGHRHDIMPGALSSESGVRDTVRPWAGIRIAGGLCENHRSGDDTRLIICRQ